MGVALVALVEQFVEEFIEWRVRGSWPVDACGPAELGDEPKLVIDCIVVAHQHAPRLGKVLPAHALASLGANVFGVPDPVTYPHGGGVEARIGDPRGPP
jgi:hypothetical protein